MMVNAIRLKKPVAKLDVRKTYLNYGWKQTNKRFPGLNPQGDIDFDGTRNKFDCKPFDPARDGILSRIANVVSGGRVGQSKSSYQAEKSVKRQERDTKRESRQQAKAESQRYKQQVRYAKEERKLQAKAIKQTTGRQRFERKLAREWKDTPYTSEQLKKTAAQKERAVVRKETYSKYIGTPGQRIHRAVKETQRAFPKAKKGKGGKRAFPKAKKGKGGKRAVGRPKGSVRMRVHPFTGQVQKIPAVEYNQLVKQAKKRRKLMATQVQQQRAQVMTKRGIPPEMAQQIARARMIREIQRGMSVTQQPIQQPTQQVQTQYPTQYPTQTQPTQQVRVVKDIMTGRNIIKRVPPKERWAR